MDAIPRHKNKTDLAWENNYKEHVEELKLQELIKENKIIRNLYHKTYKDFKRVEDKLVRKAFEKIYEDSKLMRKAYDKIYEETNFICKQWRRYNGRKT